MEFKRKRTGRSKTYREWHNALGYRITWRSEVAGVKVQPAYYACVRCVRPDGHEWWELCQHRRPYRTMKAAQAACMANHRAWEQFVKLGQAPGNRVGRLAALVKKSGGMLSFLPVWASKIADPALLRMHFKWKSQSDPSETSKNSAR